MQIKIMFYVNFLSSSSTDLFSILILYFYILFLLVVRSIMFVSSYVCYFSPFAERERIHRNRTNKRSHMYPRDCIKFLMVINLIEFVMSGFQCGLKFIHINMSFVHLNQFI